MGALLALVSSQANAAWFFADGYWVNSGFGDKFGSHAELCQARGTVNSWTYVSDVGPVSPPSPPSQPAVPTSAHTQGVCNYSQVSNWPGGYALWQWCPGTDVWEAGACRPAPPTCEHGSAQWVNGAWQCPTPPVQCPPLGGDMGAGDAQHSSNGYTGGLVCINGCSAYPRTSGQAPDGTWHAWGPYTSVGFTCSGGSSEGGSAPDLEEPPQPCPTGQCPGTLNGAPICAPCGTGQDRPPPTNTDTTTTNPDGSTTTTSTSTSTHTNCEGASCTTTTTTTTTRTTTPAGGGTPSTETTTETRTEDRPRDDYCTENPRSSQCVESSFGGSCAAQFRCEGDAVQCAIAQEQHKRACTLFEDETDLSAEGRAAVTAGDRPGDHPANEANVLQLDLASRIDTSPSFAGVGGCPSDITVAGGYTLPFSQLCGPLSVLRPAVIGFGWLIAAFVVFRRR